MRTWIVPVWILLACLGMAGCSNSGAGTTSYHPDERPTGYVPPARRTEPEPTSSHDASATPSRSTVSEAAPAATPGVTTVGADAAARQAPVRSESGLLEGEYKLPNGEIAIGPAVKTGDGRKLVPLQSKGWHCAKCKRTYNSEGWCCGQELLRIE